MENMNQAVDPKTAATGEMVQSPKGLSYLIISGGTGANSIASAFGEDPAFVLPVSDDGGSSSEILRCFGGPSIGDIRSRLIRLIPLVDKPSSRAEEERLAIYNLMAYRFPAEAAEKVVREIWMEIVEGRSILWEGIGEDKKECIRAFLVHFQTLCLRRAHKRFSFRNFSLGNGFLTGARDLFGSLPSAIFLFKSIASVNAGVQVIPVINTNQTVTIAAQLVNQSTLIGQCSISHPTPPQTPLTSAIASPLSPTFGTHRSATRPNTSLPSPTLPYMSSHLKSHTRRDSRTFDTGEPSRFRIATSGSEEGIEEEWSGGNLGYRKGVDEIPLEARIERVFYINLYGQEIYPEPNPEFIDTLNKRDVLVYSCGSLWTSIIPCLALRGLASAIASSQTLKAKVILLNSMNDRETPEYTASEYITSILGSLNHYDRPHEAAPTASAETNGVNGRIHAWKAKDLVTHIVCLEGGKVPLNSSAIEDLDVRVIIVPRSVSGVADGDTPMFSPEAVSWAMARVMEMQSTVGLA